MHINEHVYVNTPELATFQFPDSKMGVIVAIFHAVGTIDFLINRFILCVIEQIKESLCALRKLVSRPYTSIAFDKPNSFIINYLRLIYFCNWLGLGFVVVGSCLYLSYLLFYKSSAKSFCCFVWQTRWLTCKNFNFFEGFLPFAAHRTLTV